MIRRTKCISSIEIIVNTMIMIHEKEGRRIIDNTDMDNYRNLLLEKCEEEGLDVNVGYGFADYLDSRRVFKASYLYASDEEKKKIFEHYWNGDIICNEEILTCLCPYKGDSNRIGYYMMFPWVEIEDLYEFRRNSELPEYEVLANTLGMRTPKELEKLAKIENKISSFFDHMLDEEMITSQERSEIDRKRLRKMLLGCRKNGK